MNKKGFTLIELLVVIAIIGLLSTLAVVSLNNARAKSRDAKRIADVKQMQTAYELFYNDCSEYPSTGAPADNNNCPTSPAVTLGTFMATMPSAPTPADGNCTPATNDYTYLAGTNNATYTLSFCLGGTTGELGGGCKQATAAGIADVTCPTP